MKRLRIFLRILLGLILLLLLAGFFFVQHLKPEYNGTRTLDGLRDSVTVRYDSYGIPHIYGTSEADAFHALGYVHAQDRLWQMELLRRVAPGRLSEVFGAVTLETDRFFASLGIDQASRDLAAGMDAGSPEYELIKAYIDGINDFQHSGPAPPEFYLTGLKRADFTVEDVYNIVGYMAFSFAMAHKTDPFLSGLQSKLGGTYLEELLSEDPRATERIRNYDLRDTLSAGMQAAVRLGRMLERLPVPMLEGSNSWVIGPGKTSSGRVILANDPHIGFAQPSVWYEAHISTPGYEKYGYHMGGIPFPLLGHDRGRAYGMTMFENDDIDFYRETVDPADSTRYKDLDIWRDFEWEERTIRIKDSEPEVFRFRKTRRGPVMNEVIPALEGEAPVSMSWVYTQGSNRVMQALYGVGHARNLGEFEQAVSQIHAPGLNVMYGDAEGNVAWWAAARLYRLPDSVSGKLVLDAATSGPDLIRPVPFRDNPKAINPPWGYVYSANNQPDSTAAGFIPGYYLPENRARRITQLLDARDNWDKEGVMEMITDDTSPVNVQIISDLSRHVRVDVLSDSQIECVDALNRWDGSYPEDGQEGLIFHRWIYYFLRDTFVDEMGQEGFKAFMNTHLHKRLIADMAAREASVWWDDIHTADTVETKAEIVNRAFAEAMASIYSDFGPNSENWSWSEVHQLEHGHPMGQVALLRPLFNVGPFPVAGTREVINNMAFTYDSTGYYKVTSGPSTRRVIDFSDVENSMSILPTGQSGNPFSSHYEDQAELYRSGGFRKMLLNQQEIENQTEHTLIFVPGDPE